MTDNSRHTDSESSSRNAWLAFSGVVIAAFLALAGVIYNTAVSRDAPWVPVWATQTAEAKLTLIALGNTVKSTATATLVVTPTRIIPIPTITPSPSLTGTIALNPLVTPQLVTPPASIDAPYCPRPLNLELKSPTNGSAVSGVIQIRGTVKPRNAGLWYSLFYRAGIVREEMDYQIQNRVPRDRTTPVSGNIPIEFYTFTNVPIITDSILGTWDTTKVPDGWYSLRVWLREIDSQFLACDIYLAVRN
jgi:hypothetical protein